MRTWREFALCILGGMTMFVLVYLSLFITILLWGE